MAKMMYWLYNDTHVVRGEEGNGKFESIKNGKWTPDSHIAHKYFHEGYDFEEISEKEAMDILKKKGTKIK